MEISSYHTPSMAQPMMVKIVKKQEILSRSGSPGGSVAVPSPTPSEMVTRESSPTSPGLFIGNKNWVRVNTSFHVDPSLPSSNDGMHSSDIMQEIESDRVKRQQMYRFLPNPTFNPDYFYQFYDVKNNPSRPNRQRIKNTKSPQKTKNDPTMTNTIMKGSKISPQKPCLKEKQKFAKDRNKNKKDEDVVTNIAEEEKKLKDAEDVVALQKQLQIQSIYDGKRAVLPFHIESMVSKVSPVSPVIRREVQSQQKVKTPPQSPSPKAKLANVIYDRNEDRMILPTKGNPSHRSLTHQTSPPHQLFEQRKDSNLMTAEEKEDRQFDDSVDEWEGESKQNVQTPVIPFLDLTSTNNTFKNSLTPDLSPIKEEVAVDGEKSVFFANPLMEASSWISNLTTDSFLTQPLQSRDHSTPNKAGIIKNDRLYEYYRKSHTLAASSFSATQRQEQRQLERELENDENLIIRVSLTSRIPSPRNAHSPRQARQHYQHHEQQQPPDQRLLSPTTNIINHRPEYKVGTGLNLVDRYYQQIQPQKPSQVKSSANKPSKRHRKHHSLTAIPVSPPSPTRDVDFSSYVKNPAISLYDQTGNTLGIPTTDITQDFVTGKVVTSNQFEEVEQRDIADIIRNPIPIKPVIRLSDFEIPLDGILQTPVPVPINPILSSKKNKDTFLRLSDSANGEGFDELVGNESLAVNYNPTGIIPEPLPQLPALSPRSAGGKPVNPVSIVSQVTSSAEVVSNTMPIEEARPVSAQRAKAAAFSAQIQAEMKSQREVNTAVPNIAHNEVKGIGEVVMEEAEQQILTMASIATVENENSRLILFCDTISDHGKMNDEDDEEDNIDVVTVEGKMKSSHEEKNEKKKKNTKDSLHRENFDPLPPLQYDETSLFIQNKTFNKEQEDLILSTKDMSIYLPKRFNNKLTPQYEIIDLLGKGRFSNVWKTKNHLFNQNLASTSRSFIKPNNRSASYDSYESSNTTSYGSEVVAIKVYHATSEGVSRAKSELQFYTALSDYCNKRAQQGGSFLLQSKQNSSNNITRAMQTAAAIALSSTVSRPSSQAYKGDKSLLEDKEKEKGKEGEGKDEIIPQIEPKNINKQDLNISFLIDFLLFNKYYCYVFPVYSNYNLYEIITLLQYQQQYINQSIIQHFYNKQHPYHAQIAAVLSKHNHRFALFHINELKQILLQLCNACYYLHHELGFIHGDIKLENILVTMSSSTIYHIDDEIQDLIQYFNRYSSSLFSSKNNKMSNSSGISDDLSSVPFPTWRKQRDFHIVLTDFSHVMKVSDITSGVSSTPATPAAPATPNNNNTNTSIDPLEPSSTPATPVNTSSTITNDVIKDENQLIQSQFYRAPEAILSKEYGKNIFLNTSLL